MKIPAVFSAIARGYQSFARRPLAPRARPFQAGLVSRMTEDWLTTTASIDADLRMGLVRLRNRSRDLCQNNDYAKSVLREVINNVVGVGIKMQAQAKQRRGNQAGKMNKATNEAIERAWKKW